MTSISQLAELVRRSATEAGFDLVGIAPADHAPELDYFPQWIAEGRHGDMRYLELRDDCGRLKRSALQNAAPIVMRAAQRGVIHKNTASRKVSRLTSRVKALASAG